MMEYIIVTIALASALALWLEYRHRWKCRRRRNNPYELIDFQEEMRKRREK